MPRPTLVILFCLLGALPALAQRPLPPVDHLPSVVLPAPLDRVLRDYERAWRDSDAAAVAALFATDGMVLQNGQAAVRGRAEIAHNYARQMGGELRLRAVGYATSGTVGYIVGEYGYGDLRDMGRFTLTLRRGRSGRWEIFSDMDNTGPRR